ncbi:hypothetical protein KUTeg_006127 [Tegillarca granosa]|uniref:Uncharacterized protein n=1 Tax=Tegillarca granosa TaxID=220873 RepID=A0ABQ9FFK3_TEGGR|nr:hypothetical protein KUTeg_006127 [Tegillarca granosa]
MIPPDLVEDQDAEFYSEIVEVNDLYFGNFDVADTEVKSDHNHDTDDNDSESDSDCDNANISHNLDNDGQAKCSNQTRMHYSFDYAQQVHYPHYAQQVGPLFFKTPRKCQCFGVCAEGSGKYGLWRVMTARHDSMQFSLMEAGHTKFHPDWHFGLWKVKWRMSTVETLEEVAESVTKSSRNGHNIPQLVGDAQRPVIFYDWSKYLKEYFKPIPHLKTYHHFRVSRHNPGIVFVKEYANSPEVEINVLRNQNCRFPHLDPELPAVIPPKGLDPARQWYLYEEVAPYCNNKDSCKKPEVTKPILKAEQSEEYDKKRKCSHCKSCGHTKSRGGIITCPKLL